MVDVGVNPVSCPQNAAESVPGTLKLPKLTAGCEFGCMGFGRVYTWVGWEKGAESKRDMRASCFRRIGMLAEEYGFVDLLCIDRAGCSLVS